MSPSQLVQYMRDAVVNAGFDPNDPNCWKRKLLCSRVLTRDAPDQLA